MKILFNLMVMILIPMWSFSQEYNSFDFEQSVWSMHYYELTHFYSDYQEYVAGDTLINDTLFYKLRRSGKRCWSPLDPNQNPDANCQTFDESMGVLIERDRKIYYNNELLYDFNVGVGDSISHWYGGLEGVTITGVDSIEMCGKMRRRLEASQFTVGPTYFIEGVGSTAGLIPRYEYFESGSSLECFSDMNCTPCQIIIGTNNVVLEGIVDVFPNPFQDKICIRSEYNITEVKIFDMTGRLQFSAEMENEILLDHLKSGIYNLSIRVDNAFMNQIIIKN